MTRKYYLKPLENLPEEVKKQLQSINETERKKKNFESYQKALCDLYGVQPEPVTRDKNIFLGGFVEGEGSIHVSAKKQKNCKFGIEIDPEFSITQHSNGIETLLYALAYFKTGRIIYKHDSMATLVFRISNTQTIRDKVCPFYEKYVIPYAAYHRLKRYELFKRLIDALEQRKHLDKDSFINEVLPIWYDMQMQIGLQKSFNSLEEIQDYVRRYKKEGAN